MKRTTTRFVKSGILHAGILLAALASADSLKDRTLVSWAAPTTLDQRGGSALTINQGDRFDGLVFAELAKDTWMLGSDRWQRTCKEQKDWPKERTVDAFVQVAAAYRDADRTVTLYRDGVAFASYAVPQGVETAFAGNDLQAIIGIRHPGRTDTFIGKVKDARIYARALTAEQLAALKPGVMGETRPFAWWNFATAGACELTGRFAAGTLVGRAAIKDGALVLQEKGDTFIARPRAASAEAWDGKSSVPASVMAVSRRLRERIMQDPHRPFYHFACIDGIASPGDSNGAFYSNGRYHLMYLYRVAGKPAKNRQFAWGHMESVDLLHWRHLPDSIVPEQDDNGAFSGGGFVDDDGTAYLSYWMLWGARGIGLVRSVDARYEKWERHPANPVIPATRWGEGRAKSPDGSEKIVANADPSNIWKKDGRYYMLAGNKPLLDYYGRKPDSPQEFKGDRLDLYVSDDLAKWEFVKVFYKRRADETRATGWTDADEDNMCPVFLPLPDAPENGKDSGKWCLTFISHNRGCQYYIGTYDRKNDEFLPERHGRMSWVDNGYFAPESLIDGKNRHLLWTWMPGNVGMRGSYGWYGVYGLPRTLWLRPDGTLGIGVPAEFRNLRLGGAKETNVSVTDGGTHDVKAGRGDCCELSVKVPFASATTALVKVRATPDGEEEIRIWYDAAAKELVMDTSRMQDGGRPIVERAPFVLAEGEALDLDVFVDRCVVEVFANGRQAISRLACPKRADALGVFLSAQGGAATFETVEAWELAPTNPY